MATAATTGRTASRWSWLPCSTARGGRCAASCGPGNAADATALVRIVDRLRRRFTIGRVYVVANRGMISAETIAGIEARSLEYILGVRERTDKLVRDVILAYDKPFVPLVLAKRSKRTHFGSKEVKLAGRRYIVCINHEQAAKDAADRTSIVKSLKRQLARGDKALVGNTGCRRYLKTTNHVPG